MIVSPLIPSSANAAVLPSVFTGSCPNSVSAMDLNPNFALSNSMQACSDSVMVNSSIPKPKLLDFHELVTVPCNGETSMANQLEDLSKENAMLRKGLAEKSEHTPSPRGAWNDKVGDNSVGRVNLEFIPPQVINDRIAVSPPAEVEEQGLGRWKNCLVGYFLDKKVPFQMVRSINMKIWDKFGISDVLANDFGFFFFVFAHDGDLFKVLEAGPWLIGGKLLVLKKWQPHMALIKEQLQSVPIWVHFYNVPFEYWTARGLSYIASSVGKPFYCDEVTAKCKWMNFAKVCVEVNLDSSFLESVDLCCPNGDTVPVNIKYPWLPFKCMGCRIFGHSDAHCPAKPKSAPVVVPLVVGTSVQDVTWGMVSSDLGLSFGFLGGIQPGVATSPIKEGSFAVLRSSPGFPKLVLAFNIVKVSTQTPSRILICDNAAIEKVVNHYTKEPELVHTNSEKQTLVDSLFPSELDLKDIGFVTSPVVGDALIGNRFSPLDVKETEKASRCSDPIASSSAAPSKVVDEPVSGTSVLSMGIVVDSPVLQVVKGRNKGKGARQKPKLPQ
ncbi:hypothetical protein RHMOL_Rhmol01G0032000 [Rhododendron molle]|uniref:Uncharacterized protein n=1 Tax=Rhododendron molle TaxID=49168 RepID=A0ACC0PZ19_RHOML|nr:hypothetical protein RHMOL_Rhmol01G0032000 [Rhododendron molle]